MPQLIVSDEVNTLLSNLESLIVLSCFNEVKVSLGQFIINRTKYEPKPECDMFKFQSSVNIKQHTVDFLIQNGVDNIELLIELNLLFLFADELGIQDTSECQVYTEEKMTHWANLSKIMSQYYEDEKKVKGQFALKAINQAVFKAHANGLALDVAPLTEDELFPDRDIVSAARYNKGF